MRELIGRLAKENPAWGAPKIHAELQKLGFTIAERTVARYLRRVVHRGDPKQKWLAFLQNHREGIAAFDFFTVPTVTFRVLYCFFVIEHERRKILHCNVTPHPTAEWIVQQLREAFPEPCPYLRHLRSGPKVRRGSDGFLGGCRLRAETHKCAGTLAERACGALDWKLPAGASGPDHRPE